MMITDGIFKLSATQIHAFDELTLDKEAVKKAFNVAMNFYSNRTNELLKRERNLWKDIINQFALDPKIRWQAKMIDGCFSVTVSDNKEGNELC